MVVVVNPYSQVSEFGQIFVVVQLTYPTIISLPVSIQRIPETLRMLRSTISVVRFLSRYVDIFFYFPSLT